MTSLRITAPAKLNLSLHITGKRPDGYHTLESLVAFTEFGDTLEIMPADTLTLAVTGPFADALHISDEQNLVMKAASMLRLRTGCTAGARLVLHKQIPVSAGLGGGSSDAAAALRGLYRFWRIDNDHDEGVLHHIARKIGSDVPACLVRQTAWVRGAGEEVSPLTSFPEASIVLVKPAEELLTADIYRSFSGNFTPRGTMPNALPDVNSLVQAIQPKRNDLQSPAMTLLPIINDVLSAIGATRGCLLARMSGSGPTCFGIYATPHDAQHAAQGLNHTYSSWWCTATRLHDWRHAA
jgi:4-diphosphocytidyl-2-C-methyl-D-erythritol kinase